MNDVMEKEVRIVCESCMRAYKGRMMLFVISLVVALGTGMIIGSLV